jgi:hypothetical protein
LYELLSNETSPREAVLSRIAGLQVIGILLVNGFPLYDPDVDTDISEIKLLQSLISNISYHSKEVYSAASEVTTVH